MAKYTIDQINNNNIAERYGEIIYVDPNDPITQMHLQGLETPLAYWRVTPRSFGLVNRSNFSYDTDLSDEICLKRFSYCGEPRVIGYPIFVFFFGQTPPNTLSQSMFNENNKNTFYIGKTGMFEYMAENYTNSNSEMKTETTAYVAPIEIWVPYLIGMEIDDHNPEINNRSSVFGEHSFPYVMQDEVRFTLEFTFVRE